MMQYKIEYKTYNIRPSRKTYTSLDGWQELGTFPSEQEAVKAVKAIKGTKGKSLGTSLPVFIGPDYIYRILPVGTIRIVNIIPQTMADGEGLRTSIYGAGCTHNCPGCHNPQTHDPQAGQTYDLWEVLLTVLGEKYTDITFSGGDPLFQVTEFTALARLIKFFSNKTIWCYTGYVYEQVKSSTKLSQILPYIDVLVDGPFIEKLKSDCLFRGSSNQRIINIKKHKKL